MPIKIIECPRDAMQGLNDFIPTEKKIEYINQLLKVGFDTIDFGSFVSPKAIPQLKDTAEVLARLDFNNSKSKLLAIVANLRGTESACKFNEIKYIGFPFSISETFQNKNTNSSILDSLNAVKQIQELCLTNNKELVIYISMAFGNPYREEWNTDIVEHWTSQISDIGVKIISLSDTIGIASPESISYLFNKLIPRFSDVEFGAHFHTTIDAWKEKIEAAYLNGCTRFDGAILGFGGCPMATNKLTGNMPTEKIIQYFEELNMELSINKNEFKKSLIESSKIFQTFF